MKCGSILLGVLISSYVCSAEIVVDNRLTELEVAGATELTGAGGVILPSLSIPADARLVLDPIATPIKVSATPAFAAGAKIALSSDYVGMTLGRVVLMTYPGEATIPSGLFDASSVAGDAALSQETAPDGANTQLVLTVGDYENESKEIIVAPVGDSITQGIRNQGRGDYPQYRSAIAARLAANGYKPKFKGIWRKSNLDAAGVQVPDDWAYQSGFGGAKVRTSALQCGVADDMPLYLDIVGYPTVITLLIGTNDLGENTADVEAVFASWVRLVNDTAAERPDAKIIGATILPHASSPSHDAKIVSFNELLRAEYAKDGKGDLPENFYLIDLYPLVPPDAVADHMTGNYKGDNFHPNWAGNAIIAKAFYAAITNVCPWSTFAGAVDETVTDEPQTALGAAAIEDLAAYRAGMTHVFTIDRSGAAGAKSCFSAAPYTYSAGIDLAQRVVKVGYFMELVRKGTSRRRWVWVDMDARGKRLGDVDFPWDDEKMQYVAKKLHVKSNYCGIHDIAADDDSVCGIVEGTRCGYSAGKEAGGPLDVAGVPSNLMTGCGWNDTMGAGGLGYGCFQIHRIFSQAGDDTHWNDAEVLFAWNRWGLGGYADDIGIGSYACYISESGNIRTMDYTFTNVADGNFGDNISSEAYSVRHFEIWAETVPHEGSAWVDERAENSFITGEWSEDVRYGKTGNAFLDGDIVFTPYSVSTGNLVTVETKAQFCEYEGDVEPDSSAQAAVRLGPNGCFQVWRGAGNGWLDVETDGVAATSGEEYTLRLTFDYAAGTYSVDVKTGLTEFARLAEGLPLATAASCLTSVAFIGDTCFTRLSGGCALLVTGFAENDAVLLKDNAQVVLDAAKAAWLNARGDYAAVSNRLANVTSNEFATAWLCNLDLMDESANAELRITGIAVNADNVEISVALERTGAVAQAINGVLKFYGASTLEAFRSDAATLLASTAPVDDDFSKGDTATATFEKNGNAFINAEIVEKGE